MKKILLLLVFGLFSLAPAVAQEVEVIKLADLNNLLKQPKEGVVLINFWATWCRPCIEEMPYFSKAQEKYADKGVKMYFVSLDDVEILESRVKPFVKKKKLNGTVMLLDETDQNAFINRVDPQWSGAIPTTIILSGKQRKLIEGKMEPQELEALLNKYTSVP
ncbi:TlpA disulfide reductase family protein [Cesiribacter sp. SM1]|uniref:TlpA family protein disulfide reductase n=1 Tax=Cesiribacter sp. SM1 TaxID=2861196 RepID=UPI001CD7A175|nr:TlpA disulfide reductase family protein [Cesiribacter sp. SM1]